MLCAGIYSNKKNSTCQSELLPELTSSYRDLFMIPRKGIYGVGEGLLFIDGSLITWTSLSSGREVHLNSKFSTSLLRNPNYLLLKKIPCLLQLESYYFLTKSSHWALEGGHPCNTCKHEAFWGSHSCYTMRQRMNSGSLILNYGCYIR